MGELRVILVERAYRAFAARDVEALCEIADPEIEIVSVTGSVAGHEGPYVGHEGIAEYIADVLSVWDEIELTPVEFHDIGADRMLVVGRVRARRGSNLLDLPNAWIWTFSGERIRAAHVFADPRGARVFLDREAQSAVNGTALGAEALPPTA